ncbi:uncharacterized protein LOC144163650 [Haemaphysalis longicornis]
MQAEMSAMLQQRGGREMLKPKLPKPSFGSSKGGCVNSPSRENMLTVGDHSDADGNATKGSAHRRYLHDQSCLVGTSLVGSLAASCFTETGFHRVLWEEGQHYSFPYYHCRCCHLGPEFDCSPSIGSTILAPCSSRIRAPTSDLPTPSEIFGSLLKLLSSRSSEPINRYECCTVCKEMALPIESRLSAPDLVAPVPKIVDTTVDLPGRRNHWPGVFPQLNAGGLNREPPQSNGGWTGPESVELRWFVGDTGATSNSAAAWAPSQGTSPPRRSRQVLQMAPDSQDCATASQGWGFLEIAAPCPASLLLMFYFEP